MQNFTFLAVMLGAIQFITNLREQHTQLIVKKWDTVVSGINIGSSKREAIEYLHDRGEILSNLEAIDTFLSPLNLPHVAERGAQLQESKFNGSNLYQAYLAYANLYRSDFSKYESDHTNLDSVNFSNSDLRSAKFRFATLNNACFNGANLEDADFTNAHFGDTDFRGAKNLTAAQIRKAKKTYQRGIYDAQLNKELGITAIRVTDLPPAKGCLIKPRDRTWWNQWFSK